MVNIDTVYQKVLVFANKEQRGYITPQEFNLFANQAQTEILNQYFYDVNQFGRVSGNDTEYSDMLSVLQEKLSELEVRLVAQTVVNGIYNYRTLLDDVYKLGTVVNNDNGSEVEQVNNNEWYYMQSGPLTRPTLERPVFVNRIDGLNIYPTTISSIDVSYTRVPPVPSWGYIVVDGKALFDDDPLRTTNFALHASEETELVYKILKYAGVSMKRDDIAQAGMAFEKTQVEQEKQ
jgi:hypothetical protein